jgi:hypothetical protein
MANVSAPKGFVPKRHLDGSPWNGSVRMFYIPSTDATAVFVGDLVKVGGSAGTAGVVVAGIDVEGIPTAALATASTTGQDLLGAVVGFLPNPLDLNLSGRYRAASTNRIALVCVDPTVVYEVQEDGVTSNLAAADVGLNVPYSTTAGSTTTGQSKMEIIGNSKATTATLPFKILGLVKRPDNAFGLASTDKAKFEVMLNTGVFMSNTAGA